MGAKSLIVTGAAGFLGSRIAVELARDHAITALDFREPSTALRTAAPAVRWERVDIAEPTSVLSAFKRHRDSLGPPACVLHLAAFWHFGGDRHPEYDRTNVRGTQAVFDAAEACGAQRVVFASSVGALEPPPEGQCITESSRSWAAIPYGGSKAEGERMAEAFSTRVPVAHPAHRWNLYGMVRTPAALEHPAAVGRQRLDCQDAAGLGAFRLCLPASRRPGLHGPARGRTQFEVGTLRDAIGRKSGRDHPRGTLSIGSPGRRRISRTFACTEIARQGRRGRAMCMGQAYGPHAL